VVETCHVCGQPLVEKDTADCDYCGRNFHLAVTQNSTTKDCGIVFNDEEDFFLIFECRSCQEKAAQAAQEEPAAAD